MSSSTQAPADHLAANLDALRVAQSVFVPPMEEGCGRVRLLDGAWRVVDDDGRTLAIHSRHPDTEADRSVAEMLDGASSPALIVAIGLGLGFFLDALERRQWHGTVLALEPEPASIAPLLSRREWHSWTGEGRLRVLAAPQYDGASTCWSLFGDGSWTPPVVVNPVFARTRPVEVERARALVGRLQFEAKANADARRRFGGRYLLNTLANLPALASESDVSHLADVARGLPAIVVGAGPSLDAALSALRLAQDSTLIIAVDTALRPLLAAGIRPHLVAAVDPGEANAQHFWDLPPCPDTHLVAEASVDPIAFAPFRGRTFLFSVADHQPWPWLAAHGQARGRLRAWGSVLTVAFDLALHVGADPIVFAGADLAFSGGRPYGRGVTYDEHFRRMADWGVSYETQWHDLIEAWPRTEEADVTGAPVRTAPHLVAVRDWLVEQTTRERGQRPDRRFVNACGAGILQGPAIEQAALTDIVASAPAARTTPARSIRACYRAAEGDALRHAATALVERAGRGDSEPADPTVEGLLSTWQDFGDGLTRARILDALSHASRDDGMPAAVSEPAAASEHPAVVFDACWSQPLAAGVPLVWMPIAHVHMAPFQDGIRLFRFRTMTARLIGCLLRVPAGAVTEDGWPLTPGAGVGRFDELKPGEYCFARDEVYFTSTDGSDPRYNRRQYRLLVPSSVAYLEALPLAEILSRQL